MNVLITGVSQGIGKALLNVFLNHPSIHKVYACTRDKNLINIASTKLHLISLDFLDASSWKNLEPILQENPIHILINNAGYLSCQSFSETSVQEVKKVFEINFFAPYKLIQKLLPNLSTGKAHVINIGSMGGFQGSAKFSGLSAYSASKAALANLTECLANEFSKENIKFNCLALGAVDTEMLKKAFPTYLANVSANKIAQSIMEFALNWKEVVNGKVIPMSVSTP